LVESALGFAALWRLYAACPPGAAAGPAFASLLLERLGVNVAGEQFRPKNVASVFVTASLPPFARAGSQIDVTVSAIGDAQSLRGGTLIMTPLNGADGQIYAVVLICHQQRLFLHLN
jgi:hypothetical protein